MRLRPTAPGFVKFAAITVAVLYTVCLALFIGKVSFFAGDDFRGFVTAGKFTFGKVLLVPVGSQVAPLHRAVNMAHFHLARMNYPAALGVLFVFQAIGVVYLYRVLQSFRASAVNLVIIAWYCAYAHLGLTIDWWSSGLQRIPYVALSLFTIFHYLRYVRGQKRAELVLTVLGFLAALGFYGKTVTIPLVLLALDVLDGMYGGRSRSFDKAFLRRFAICVGLAVIAVLYVPLARVVAGGTVKESLGFLDPAFQLKFQLMAFTVAAHGAFGIVLGLLDYHPRWSVGIVWMLAIVYTTYRSRRAAIAWLALVLLLATNFLMFAISSRTGAFGLAVACELRYFYEVAFLFALFVGLVIHAQPHDSPEARAIGRAGRGWLGAFALALVLALYAIGSFRSMASIRFIQTQEFLKTREYVDRLKHGFSAIEDEGAEAPRLVDGQLPIYVTGLDFEFTRHSQLLELLQLDARFEEESKAEYKIDEAGDVVRLRP